LTPLIEEEMTPNACHISATTTSQFQSTPLPQSPETSGDTLQNKSFIQIDQATAFQLLQELDPTEFKILLFLTLRAYGWDEKARRVGDGTSRASGTFVAKGTGLSAATAERCIGRLKEKGLISKWTHSCKWGNTYQVKPILLRRCSDDKAPATHDKKKKFPQIEEPKLEEPQNNAPSSLKIMPLGPSNCGTSIDSRYSDFSLSLSKTFEDYFSKIRAPKAEKNERDCLALIQKRNPDVTSTEFLECFNLVSKTKDAKGRPVAMKFLWMSNGFDTILAEAREKIQAGKRREEEQRQVQQQAQAEAALAQQVSPRDVELAKSFISRAFTRSGPMRSMPSAQNTTQSEQERRAFLLAQARQLSMAASANNTYSAI
jgi:hypothetical protein